MSEILVVTTAAASFCTLGLVLGAFVTTGMFLIRRPAAIGSPDIHTYWWDEGWNPAPTAHTDLATAPELAPTDPASPYTPRGEARVISPATPSTADDRTAQTVGPYRLLSLLGHGAMGEVWRAFDTRRQRTVALKLLPAHSGIPGHTHERVHREAELAGRLSSAHVIPIHDFGWIGADAFIDMRLVPGGDLATLLCDHPQGLEPGRAARILTQIADALDAAHGAGLVHCDVKPSNVLLDATAEGDFCYLADFGIATLARTLTTWTGPSTPTGEGLIVGTPTYMAPELFTGLGSSAGRPSVASDVYGLAVVLYELLTGRPPFPGSDIATLNDQHTHTTPAPVSSTAPSLAVLDPILARGLSKDPALRYPSAGAFAAAVSTALTSPTSAGAPPCSAAPSVGIASLTSGALDPASIPGGSPESAGGEPHAEGPRPRGPKSGGPDVPEPEGRSLARHAIPPRPRTVDDSLDAVFTSTSTLTSTPTRTSPPPSDRHLPRAARSRRSRRAAPAVAA